jgi:hypothetical protein
MSALHTNRAALRGVSGFRVAARRGAVVCIALLLLCMAATAQALMLGDEIVVDPSGETVYLVTPSGYTQAVAVDDGRTHWASREPASPVAWLDGRLLALGVPAQRGMGLLMIIDPATGETVDRMAFDVPENVAATREPRPLRRFSLQTEALPDRLRVHWRFVGKPLRGALLDRDEDGNPTIERTVPVDFGSFDVLADGARTLVIPLRSATEPPPPAGPALTDSESLPGVTGVQYRAADDTAVLASVAVPDDNFVTAYRWKIHARSDAKLLGEIRSPYAYAPFMVRGDVVVYRAEPVYQRRGDGHIALASRLVGHDLATGVERWSIPVREAAYRGPLPP